MKNLKTAILLGLLLSFITSGLISKQAGAISTEGFNPNRIIDDAIFFNGGRMGTSDIQAFLNAKVPTCDTNGELPPPPEGSAYPTRAAWGNANPNDSIPSPPYTCLRHYSQSFATMPADSYCGAVQGGTRSAADIIAAVGQACGVNPQVILITLQKEQSFITDNWPWPIQYTKATGYGCPDTPLSTAVDANQNGCYDEFEGFFKQIYYGARQFKRYIMQPDVFNYAVGRTSFVGYNPNPGCGGTNLTPNTQATAALYNYTPYQPNPATLAAPEGVEVNCGAYGNLNFWRKFNDWFGPTLTDEFAVIMADNGDPTQWVLENGRRYVIPDTATKVAYGLSPKWDQPYVFNGSYISTLPNGPAISRIVRPSGDLGVYFVDSGRKYRFRSVESMAAWGYDTNSIVDLPIGLSNNASTQGDITYTISLSGDPRVFLMDGGILRHITDPNLLIAWVGENVSNIPISNDYFSSRQIGTAINSPKITDGSNTYFVDNARKLIVDSLTTQLFPNWATHSVSSATLNRLTNGPRATYVIKAAGSTAAYIVDQQQKHHVTDPYVFAAWQSSTFPSTITELTNGFMNTVANGSQITDFLMSSGSNSYVMQGGIRPIPANLVSAYTSTRAVYNASSQLASLYPVIAGVTGLVKASGQPQTYIITNSGQLRHLTSTNLFWLWGRNHTLTEITQQNLGRYANGGGISAFVSDGTTNYVMESGQKHTVSNTTKNNWQLGNPDILDSGTLSRYSTGIALPEKIQNSGQYFMIHEGKSFGTVDGNLAGIWNIIDAPTMDLAVISELLRPQMLTRIASSTVPGDSRLFIVDRGQLYHLSPGHAVNMLANGPFTAVNPGAFTIQTWTSAVVKDEGGVVYVIDAGQKRLIPAGIIRDQWTFGNYASIPTMTNGFLNKYPNGPQIERAIKASGPQVYAAENFKKRWIQSPNTYSAQYAPFTQVNESLINVLPDGQSIP